MKSRVIEMSIQTFIDLFEKGNVTEDIVEQMQHFAFEAEDDEIFIIAQIFAALGRASQSIELVESLFAKYPEDVNLKTFLADLYLDLGEDEKAFAIIADEDEDENIQLLMLAADMYMSQGLFEVAEEKLKKALALEPKNELIQLAYAEFYYHIGEFEEALPRFLNLLEYGIELDLNVYDRLANCYSHIGEFEKALKQWIASETYIGKLDTNQLFSKAISAYQLEDFATAKRALWDIKELDPTYDTIYPLLGKIYAAEQEHDKALEVVQEGINYNEYNAELYYLKGLILEAMKDLEGARDAYYEALNLDPEDLESALRSNRLCLALEDFEEVVHNVDHYEEWGLYDERFSWDLAIAHLELENYEKSNHYFQEAAVHFAENVEFLFDYAQFLIEDGRRQEARLKLEKILQIDGTLLAASELLENLM